MKNLYVNEITDITLLNNKELIETNGGDDFLSNLGFSIGWIGAAIEDAVNSISEMFDENLQVLEATNPVSVWN